MLINQVLNCMVLRHAWHDHSKKKRDGKNLSYSHGVPLPFMCKIKFMPAREQLHIFNCILSNWHFKQMRTLNKNNLSCILTYNAKLVYYPLTFDNMTLL